MKSNDKHEAVSRIAGRGLVLVGLLAMVLSTTIISRAQSSAAPPASAAKVPASVAAPAVSPGKTSPEAAVKPPAKGQHEGIAVHGHWTIVVKNPDGKVVSRQEFENALDPNEGADLLTGLLSGEYTNLGFFVGLYSQIGSLCGQYGVGYCVFYDGRNPNWSSYQLFTQPNGSLAYTPNSGTSNSNGVGFALVGTVGIPTSATATTITSVVSGAVACLSSSQLLSSSSGTDFTGIANATATTAFTSYGPSGSNQCSDGVATALALTSTSVSQTISAGQSVTVSVVITFGSGS
jgi:hypothetical protein